MGLHEGHDYTCALDTNLNCDFPVDPVSAFFVLVSKT